MFDLFGPGGFKPDRATLDAMSRAYGIDPAAAARAFAALAPAFQEAAQRAMQDPLAAMRAFQSLAVENFAAASENPQRAFADEAIDQGNDALAALFGTKEVSRAVADQAAQASGLGAEMLKRMLPGVASVIVGSLVKSVMGGSLKGVLDGLGGRRGEEGGAAFPQFPGFPGAGPRSGDPFGALIDDFLKTVIASGPMRAATPDEEAPQPPPPPPGEAPAADQPPDEEAPTGETSEEDERTRDPFAQMGEAGLEISRANAKAMSEIFDRFFGPKTG